MKRNHIIALFFLFQLMFTYGCNSDIFIDGYNEKDNEISATVEGDGGSAKFSINTKWLNNISLDMTDDGQRYCTYYNQAGEKIDSKHQASEIGRIVFDNTLAKFEIIKNGSELTFSSISNTCCTSNWVIRLEYDYIIRFINVDILQGKPMKLSSVEYNSNIEISDNDIVMKKSKGFTNNGPISQVVDVYPYLQEKSSIKVEPFNYYSWVKGETLTMCVPVHEDGGWKLKEVSGIQPGYSFTKYRTDQMLSVPVTVAANSSVDIITEVTYTKAKANGTMIFVNPVTDYKINVGFMVTSLYPVNYELHVEKK